MKPSLKRMISMLVSFALVVSAMVIFFNLIRPEYARLESNKATEESRKDEVARRKDVEKLIAERGGEYDRSVEEREALFLALPDRRGTDTALHQISGLAAGYGISVSSVAISEQENSASYDAARRDPNALENLIVKPKAISFSVTAAGPYKDFRAFLAGVETNLRIFDVKDVSIQQSATTALPSPRGQAPAAIYNYKINLQAYYLPI